MSLSPASEVPSPQKLLAAVFPLSKDINKLKDYFILATASLMSNLPEQRLLVDVSSNIIFPQHTYIP